MPVSRGRHSSVYDHKDCECTLTRFVVRVRLPLHVVFHLVVQKEFLSFFLQCRPFPKQKSHGEKLQPPDTLLSSRGGDSRRPGWISEGDWREVGSSSVTRSSPVNRLGPICRPAHTARMQRKTATVMTTFSEVPRRHRRPQQDVSRQSQVLANLHLGDQATFAASCIFFPLLLQDVVHWSRYSPFKNLAAAGLSKIQQRRRRFHPYTVLKASGCFRCIRSQRSFA